MRGSWSLILPGILVLVLARSAPGQKKNHRLPAVDLKERIIWGTTCEGPDGLALAFGGQDQQADDGRPHTRLRVKGEWQTIHADLRSRHPLQKSADRCLALGKGQKETTARARHLYLEGLTADAEAKRVKLEVSAPQEQQNRHLTALAGELKEMADRLKGYEAGQAGHAAARLRDCLEQAGKVRAGLGERLKPALIEDMRSLQVALEQAAQTLDAEPPPRALGALAYDPRSRLFVLFGGDHLDYLLNDTWVFDPARRRWEQRHPPTAPSPRANHRLEARGEGKIVLSGGYTYTSSTDYMGGQYRDVPEEDWTYDVAASTWTEARELPPMAGSTAPALSCPSISSRDRDPMRRPLPSGCGRCRRIPG
jgi:hypothetical protein